MTEEQWVKTREASLHYLITKGDRNLTPLVYIPGSLGSAADFQDEIEALAPRTTVAVNPRGQGRS